MENSQIPQPERSHFEPIEKVQMCNHPEHNPPMHLYIPFGQRYIHICPACGNRLALQPPQITWNTGQLKSAEDMLKDSGLDFDWMSSKYTKNVILQTMENYANQFKSEK